MDGAGAGIEGESVNKYVFWGLLAAGWSGAAQANAFDDLDQGLLRDGFDARRSNTSGSTPSTSASLPTMSMVAA